MDFMDCMECYGAGRAAITIEPANEASILYDEGGPVAEGTRTALMPGGPARHAPRWAVHPPYAIPSRSRAPRRRRGSSPSSCARPSRCSTTCEKSGFVEVARDSLLRDPRSPPASGLSFWRRQSRRASLLAASARDQLRDGGRQPDRRRDRSSAHRRARGRGGDGQRRADRRRARPSVVSVGR